MIHHASPTPGAPTRDLRTLRGTVIAAIACFAVAAAAGALMRFGLVHGLPFGWTPENVRFAHTHLMYFGWVAPALFALIGAHLVQRSARPLPRAFLAGIVASLAAGALSFVPFLVSGYRPTSVLGVALPLSMIASTLAVLAWSVWALGYVVATRRLERDLGLLALDAAVLALLLATTGAWGLALVAFAPVASGSLMDALVHLYLDTFSNGFFALAVVGLLMARVRDRIDLSLGRPALTLFVAGTLGGSLVSFGNGPAWLLLTLHLAAAYGGIVLALLLGAAAWQAPRCREAAAHLLIALLLAGKALLGGALAFEGVARGVETLALPIVLTHAYLLGLVSLAIVLLTLERWRPEAHAAFWLTALAVTAMLVLQLPLTHAWPLPRGGWVLGAAAWSTLAPLVAMLVVGLALWRPGATLRQAVRGLEPPSPRARQR